MNRLRHPNIVLVMGISLVEQEPLPLPKSRSNKTEEMLDMEGNGGGKSDKKTTGRKPQKTVCIITEFLDQGSLADILYGPSKLPAEIWTYELVLTCALQAARGMLYLHSHSPPICHRDLKSSNLVVDDHWVVKVTDFGMSRIVPEKVQEQEKGIGEEYYERESITRNSLLGANTTDTSYGANSNLTGLSLLAAVGGNNTSAIAKQDLEMTSNLGTTAWCAPELLTASSTARYSIKVDVYSFGMVLWELWEKKRPFDEFTSRFDIMDAVRSGKRPYISDSCPPTFKALIQRCWQADPTRRPTFNYIVRYLKDELGRVKRNKPTISPALLSSNSSNNTTGAGTATTAGATGNGNGNGNGSNNNNSRASMTSYIRSSLSAFTPNATHGSANSNNGSTHRLSLFRSSLANSNNSQAGSDSGSVGRGGGGGGGEYGSYPDQQTGNLKNFIGDHNNGGGGEGSEEMMGLDEDDEAYNVRERLSSDELDEPNPDHHYHNQHHNQQQQQQQQMSDLPSNLPPGRTPLVRAAVDRSLSYLTESPMTQSPITNYTRYGAGQGWRDRYVMKFSGWNSSNPDAGLPPSRNTISVSPNTSTGVVMPPPTTNTTTGAVAGTSGGGFMGVIGAPRNVIRTPARPIQQPVANTNTANTTVNTTANTTAGQRTVSGSLGTTNMISNNTNSTNQQAGVSVSSSVASNQAPSSSTIASSMGSSMDSQMEYNPMFTLDNDHHNHNNNNQ